MNEPWLPLVAEDVTAQWLSDALALGYPGTRVEQLDVNEILWGTGTKMMVTATYNDAGKAHGLPPALCIKAGLAEHRELVKFCYQTEARFFAELAPRLTLGLPKSSTPRRTLTREWWSWRILGRQVPISAASSSR